MQKVVEQHPGKVRFVSENFGASKLAQRFGVTRYPAVFVNDILVARPRDFGFVGAGEETGRYTPWRDSASQARFQADLERMVEKVLAGKQAELRKESARATAQAAASGAGDDLAQLPSFALTDLAGRPLAKEQLAGRVVLVEFWATWCPPCRSTLEWLGTLQQKYGDKIAVVALAVESPEDQVRATTAKLNPQLRWAMADGPTARAFGGIVAVPTLFLFDRTGKTVRVLYGAPSDLHQVAERALATAAR